MNHKLTTNNEKRYKNRVESQGPGFLFRRNFQTNILPRSNFIPADCIYKKVVTFTESKLFN